MARIGIDEYSGAALPIQMIFEKAVIATGTAFVMTHDEQPHLVTNWHNVTGMNPLTGEHISTTAAEPDKFRTWLPVEGNLGAWKTIEIPVVEVDGTPLWREHPDFGRNVDVAAIPFDCPDGLTFYPVNKMGQKSDMKVSVGHDIYILGFPFSLSPIGAFPVWKRGSIATEPELDIDKLPKFMVDTASRPGMSGSPVIQRSWGSYLSDDGSMGMGTGTFTKFLGIYSGRIGAEDELKAQLGIVWRAEAITQILRSGKSGEK
ncbi:trypsin-like peptidase domain-containing protein [Nitrospinota bacterium]